MSVEDQLVTLNEQYESYLAIYDASGSFEMAAHSSPLLKKAVELVEAHTTRIMRAIVREALALPASSVRAFALQARIIAAEAGDLWDGEEISHHEHECRGLLDSLLGAAGLSRIRRPEIQTEDLRRWLVDPETLPGGPRYKEEPRL